MTRREREHLASYIAPGRCECCGHKLVAWTPERIFEAFHAWTEKHGRIPTATDWAKGTADHPAQATVGAMFGTWNNGISAVGLAERARMEREPVWTRQTIADAMLDHRTREGRWPTWRDWAKAKGRRSRERPASWSVVRAFGTWQAAIDFASGVTDPNVATEYRAIQSGRRLADVAA